MLHNISEEVFYVILRNTSVGVLYKISTKYNVCNYRENFLLSETDCVGIQLRFRSREDDLIMIN
jgi:hypothetical protein